MTYTPLIKYKGKRIRVNGRRRALWLEFRERYVRELGDRTPCHYCGTELTKERVTLDHKNGRAGTLLVSHSNIVVACYNCNRDKGSTGYDDYMKKIGKANESD